MTVAAMVDLIFLFLLGLGYRRWLTLQNFKALQARRTAETERGLNGRYPCPASPPHAHLVEVWTVPVMGTPSWLCAWWCPDCETQFYWDRPPYSRAPAEPPRLSRPAPGGVSPEVAIQRAWDAEIKRHRPRNDRARLYTSVECWRCGLAALMTEEALSRIDSHTWVCLACQRENTSKGDDEFLEAIEDNTQGLRTFYFGDSNA